MLSDGGEGSLCEMPEENVFGGETEMLGFAWGGLAHLPINCYSFNGSPVTFTSAIGSVCLSFNWMRIFPERRQSAVSHSTMYGSLDGSSFSDSSSSASSQSTKFSSFFPATETFKPQWTPKNISKVIFTS